MIGPEPETEEEKEKFELEYYENEKEDAEAAAKSIFHLEGEKKRRSIITQIACVKYLGYMKNDRKLNLSDEEYQYARRIAFERIKEELMKDYFVKEDELESEEMKEYFTSIGFADLL